MRDNIILADKVPYASLFNGWDLDIMPVVKILSKRKDGIKKYQSYLQTGKDYVKSRGLMGSNRNQVLDFLLNTEPVYIKENENTDDLYLTTIIYPFNTKKGINRNFADLFHQEIDKDMVRINLPYSYYRSQESTTICVTPKLDDMLIEVACYDRTTRSVGWCLAFSKDGKEIDNEFADNARRKLNILNRVSNAKGIKLTCNPKKEYTLNSVVKAVYKIYDNLEEGLNDYELGDISFSPLNGVIQTLSRGGYVLRNNRMRVSSANKYLYKPFTFKYKAKIIGNKIVFYDGKKALDYFEDKIENWNSKIRVVYLMQYKGFEYIPAMDCVQGRHKAVIRFANPKDYSFGDNHILVEGDARGSAGGQIWHKHKSMGYTISYDLRQNSSSYNPTFEGIVPYGEHMEEAISLIDYMLSHTDNNRFREYMGCLMSMPELKEEDDILSSWFESCVKTKKQNDNNIIRAYCDMKANLLREYKDLENYIGYYDFSKVIPVPKIILDKKTKENFYKSLHIQPQNIIINNVNNKKIKEINKTQAMVKLMVTKGQGIYTDNYPLVKYYNPTTNTLEFDYNKMKGELIHDKTKNRR